MGSTFTQATSAYGPVQSSKRMHGKVGCPRTVPLILLLTRTSKTSECSHETVQASAQEAWKCFGATYPVEALV